MSTVPGLAGVCKQLLKLSISHNVNPSRGYLQRTRLRFPDWFMKKERIASKDNITAENRDFINEVIKERLQSTSALNNSVNHESSPLKNEITNYGVWNPRTKRTGLIAKNIGQYPLWSKDGRRILTTLLQVVDNQVVKYIPPEEFNPPRQPATRIYNRKGCLLVGSETIDPSLLTKEYYGLFNSTGVLPKRHLCRFLVSPEAALSSGTPLTVSHYRVGDVIDVRGKTVDHGFQGVMKRWGFKGMPASHGVTKTHRRPGNIGGGGEKGRVWPGTKLPGHMGNNWRVLRGVTILRINTKHNVLWVKGGGIPGTVNSLCYLYDTVLPLRRFKSAPPFPTHITTGEEPEEIWHESMHHFDNSTITFAE